MIAIVRVRAAFGHLFIEHLQTRIIDFLQSYARGIKAHRRVLAHQPEKLPAIFFALTVLVLISQMLEQFRLLGTTQFGEGFLVR